MRNSLSLLLLGAAAAYPLDALFAVRTPTTFDLGQTIPTFIDVLLPLASGGAALLQTIELGANLTLRRSTVESSLSATDDHCLVSLAGYRAPPFAASPNLDPGLARVAATFSPDGSAAFSFDSALSSLAQAGGDAQARGAYIAAAAPPSLGFVSNRGITRPQPLGSNRTPADFPGGAQEELLSLDANVRFASVYRGALYASTASLGPGAGVWRVLDGSAPLPPPGTTLPLGTPVAFTGTTVNAAGWGPASFAFVDDFTLLVAAREFGVQAFRSPLAADPPGAATDLWQLAGTAVLPAGSVSTDFPGVAEVAVAPCAACAGGRPRMYAVSNSQARAAAPSPANLTSTIFVLTADALFQSLAATPLLTSPPGYEYRGLAAAPSCAPLPSPTPFPAASPRPAPSPPAPPFPPGTLIATRTSTASADTNTALEVTVDVLGASVGGGAGVLLRSTALGTNITLRRSPVEGFLSRSECGCYVSFGGYSSPPGTPAPQTDAAAPRVAALMWSAGTFNFSTADGALAALAAGGGGAGAQPRAAFVSSRGASTAERRAGRVGVEFASNLGLTRPLPAGSARGPAAAATELFTTRPDMNIRTGGWWRGALYVSTASSAGGLVPGVWRLLNASEPIPAVGVNISNGGIGALVAATGSIAPTGGPTDFAFLDDATLLVCEAALGVQVFALAPQPGANGSFTLASTVPALDGGGCRALGVDYTQSPPAAYFIGAGGGPASGAIHSLRAAAAGGGLQAALFLAPPAGGWEYRGLAGAPACSAPLPSLSASATPSATPPPPPPAAAAPAAAALAPDSPTVIGSALALGLGGCVLGALAAYALFARRAAAAGAPPTSAGAPAVREWGAAAGDKAVGNPLAAASFAAAGEVAVELPGMVPKAATPKAVV